MITFVIRRLLLLIPLLVAVSVLSFGIMVMAPGNYVDTLRQNPQIKAETIKRFEINYGFKDKAGKSISAPRRYVRWLFGGPNAEGKYERGALLGNLGESMEFHQPVLGLIAPRAYATFLLALCATIFAWSLAIPLGILSATRQYSPTDMGLTVLGFLGLSIPSVVSSLVFLLIAAKSHAWFIQFPTGDMQRLDAGDYGFFWRARDLLWHLILPSFALGIISIAPYMRQMRGQMLEVLNSDFIRTARAKGLGERTVIWKHAVRNAINPMITLFGYSLASLLSGSFVIEIVMNWPGLAPLTLNAILKNDVPLVLADLLIAALLLVLGNLIADLMLAWADPRIKLA
jgi:peptide/nickel transport system permease protein